MLKSLLHCILFRTSAHCSCWSNSALPCFSPLPALNLCPLASAPFPSTHCTVHLSFPFPLSLFPFPQDAAIARRLLLDNQRLAAEVAASTDEALVDARAALERRERQLEAVRAQKTQLQVRVSQSVGWSACLPVSGLLAGQ